MVVLVNDKLDEFAEKELRIAPTKCQLNMEKKHTPSSLLKDPARSVELRLVRVHPNKNRLQQPANYPV